MPNEAELVDTILEALRLLQSGSPEALRLAGTLYKYDSRLDALIATFATSMAIPTPTRAELQERGRLLERIAFVAFKGVRGLSSVKSFQSAGPQLDLLLAGNDAQWMLCWRVWGLSDSKTGILVECKAWASPVDDAEFARLCSLLADTLPHVGLGVFFSIAGATGFPKPKAASRLRKVSDARLRQLLFHARTGIPVVVFNEDDIRSLLGGGEALFRMIQRKVRDIGEVSGLATMPPSQVVEVDLPDHLASLNDL